MKKLLKKSSYTNIDAYIALMLYRNNSLCFPAHQETLDLKFLSFSSLKPKLVEVENYNKQISTKTDNVVLL